MIKTNIQLEIEAFILPLLKSKRTYLDIGANIGKASVPFINIFDRVISFEPNPIALEKFKSRPESQKLQIEEVAVSDYSGTGEFTCPASGETQAHQHGSMNQNHIQTNKRFLERKLYTYPVDVVTIDSYKLTDVDFIKIDTEGNEYNVLIGALETIKKCKPIIYYESKIPDESKERIRKLFTKIGYNTQITRRNWGDSKKKCDMLATPNL